MQHLVYLLAWLAVQWTQMWVNAKQKQDKNMTNALTDKRSENRKRVVIVVEDSPKAISNIRCSQTKCEPSYEDSNKCQFSCWSGYCMCRLRMRLKMLTRKYVSISI